ELAAGRLFLTDSISREDEGGATVASFKDGGTRVHWSRLGDLLVVSSSTDGLRRAVASCRAIGGAAVDAEAAWSTEAAERFELTCLGSDPGEGPAAEARAVGPERLLAAAGVDVRRSRSLMLSAGLPAPVEATAISLRLDGDDVLEETFLRARHRTRSEPGNPAFARPEGTYFYSDFRMDGKRAAERLWRFVRKAVPPARGRSLDERRAAALAGARLFEALVLPRVNEDVVLALAEQEVSGPDVGFPAQYTFLRVEGAGEIRRTLEQVLRARGLGLFNEGDALPVRYSFVVRHRVRGVPVYELGIRDARRHEGYVPAIAIRKGADGHPDEVICCTSIESLKGYLAGKTAPAPVQDTWLALDGAEALRLEWRAPDDLAPLGKAYTYYVELARHGSWDVEKELNDDTDYDALWRAIESVLREVRSHERVGARETDGLRMRARWGLAE
ncbi:MAG: hypothetical protein ACYS9X_25915, partial [Planctomycetota bacterium]